jgi:hypothetical protein
MIMTFYKKLTIWVFIGLLGWMPSALASTSTVPTDANGNVGIGTTVPMAGLAVGPGIPNAMAVAGGNDVYVAGNLEFDGAIYGNGSQLTGLDAVTGWIKSGQNVYTSDAANVGIGTTVPTQVFDIVGNIRLQNTTSANTGVIYKTTTWSIHNFQHPIGGGAVPVGRNTFVGIDAGNFTMGSTATTVGQASYNTVSGTWALTNNSIGSSNTASGVSALHGNTSGSNNTASGTWALAVNSTGTNNTASGYYPLYRNTSGSNNTASGIVLGYNVNGNNNIAEGNYALQYNVAGSNNTVIGGYAGGGGYGSIVGADLQNTVAIGYQAGRLLGTGDNNILLGYRAGDNLTTGDNNILLGYDIEARTTTSTNTLSIGNLIFGTTLDGAGTAVSTGGIGIGLTTPRSRLTIFGAATSTSRVLEVDNSLYEPKLIVLDNGNVGLGTAVPAATLEVHANSGVPAMMVSSVNMDGNLFIVDAAGNVGFGTASPRVKLDVSGSVAIKGTSTPGVEGEFVYDLTTDYYKYYDGSQWLHLAGTGINFSGGIWNQIDTNIYYNAGYVGIGTTYPDDQLTLFQGADSDGIHLNGFDDRSANYGEFHINSAGEMEMRSDLEMVFDIGGTNFIAGSGYFTHYRTVRLADNLGVSLGTDSDYSIGYRPDTDIFYISDGASLTANPRLRFDASGNTQVGALAPVALFDVDRRFTVRSAGNVGIGTFVPAAAFVVGTGAPSWTFTPPLDANDALVKGRLEVDGNVYINGNVGIRDTIPGKQIFFNGNINLLNSGSGYMFGGPSLGVFWPSGTNDISLVTGGVERMRILAAGNVGVGTSAPLAAFHAGTGAPAMVLSPLLDGNDALVRGRAEVDNGLLVVGNVGIGTTAAATQVQMSYLNNSTTTVADGLTIHNESNTAGALAGLRFSTYGNVIGGYYAKQFIGGMRESAGYGSGPIVFLNRDAEDQEVVRAQDERMRITRYGNVGIGTSTPVALLHLGGGGSVPNAMNITGADAYIKGNLEVDGRIYGDGSALTGGSQWVTSGNDIYYTTGNVGISTTAPLAALTIGSGTPASGLPPYGLYANRGVECDGAVYFHGPVYFNSDDVQIHNSLYLSSEGSDLKYAGERNTVFTKYAYRDVEHDHPNNTDPFVYVHSGTDPDVSNNQWGALTHDTNNFVFSTGVNVGTGSAPTTTENAVVFSPRGTEAMRVAGAGNVGIGTTVPLSTLVVVGSLEIPHSAAPSLTSDGQIALETDSDSINVQAGSGTAGKIPVNTDVAIPLIHQKDVVFTEPDQLITVTDKLPWFTVDAYDYPSGITVTAVRVATSASSTDTYSIEEWTDPATYSKDIVAVPLAAVTEATVTTITSASVSAGSYVFIDLDDAQDNINWCKLTIWFYVND